jgi:predicted nucleic acid-binding protein
MVILYLDVNIYKRPFDDHQQMRIRLETVAIAMIFTLIERRQMSSRCSFVQDFENSLDPNAHRRQFTQSMSKCCDSAVEPDDAIRELARRLAERYTIYGRDALHLACAESSGCDYLVTCDDRLVRQ